MKLKKLISGLPIEVYKGCQNVEITGLTDHSKLVAPGHLFIAKKGYAEEGARHIEEALAAGAVALLTDQPNPFIKGVTQLLAPSSLDLGALLAARFYHYPTRELFAVGVTGTNGKTTTTYLIKHLYDQLGFSCGLIGTVEYIIGRHRLEAERTTPDALTNQKLLREMVKQGCNSVAMEVSSHGLAQNRCAEIHFDVALFTNLSQDHLDYHETMERYAFEKAKLFKNLALGKKGIINNESEWAETMVAECQAEIIRYGFSQNSDLFATDIVLHSKGTEFNVHYKGERVFFKWKMIGRYNILNALAAIAATLSRGVELQTLPPLIENFPGVPGRLEKVDNRKGLNIFVDYAHTPDALEKVLGCLKEIKTGKIITLFGCGGDRDRGKRPKMAQASEEGSDYTFVTSDNPRSEMPEKICDDIIKGFTSSNYTIELDRRSAIEKAIQMATPDDVILIAGKGHEAYQQFSFRTIPFDDRKVAMEIANQ